MERVFRAEREESAKVREYVEGMEGEIALEMGPLHGQGRKDGTHFDLFGLDDDTHQHPTCSPSLPICITSFVLSASLY